MKKFISIIILALCLCTGVAGLAACGEKDILVVSREAGSGTRDAFDSLIKNSAGDSLAKKADGTAQPSSVFVKSLNIQDGTAKVMTKISSSKNAIGYISLGSVDDTVKVIKVGNIAPASASVLDGSYKLQRPFVIMTNKDTALTAAAGDFMKYLKSSDAQTVIAANNFIKQENSEMTAYSAPETALTGSVKLRGSTSVEPLMQKFLADYLAKGGAKVSDISFDLDAQGSSSGISAVKADSTGDVIGMSSSTIKSADAPVLDYINIALDAVAIIVNKNNTIDNLTVAQLFDIYTGALKKFPSKA